MIPQIPEVKTGNKSPDQILDELVKAVNIMGQQMQLALQNIDMGDVVTEMGVSLEALLNSGVLKGNPGDQGPTGRVWLPTVTDAGMISWRLTDEGGQQPATQNVRGPQGVSGVNGVDGLDGTNGIGVPAGGTAGQILVKRSNVDYDCEWVSQG